jgi:hypothetical protein
MTSYWLFVIRYSLPYYTIYDYTIHESELHSHDFPVGIHYFVSNLKQKAKGNIGLLTGYHGLMDASFSFQELFNRLIGLYLHIAHTLYSLFDDITKAGRASAPFLVSLIEAGPHVLFNP